MSHYIIHLYIYTILYPTLGMSRLPPLNYDFQSQGDGDVDWQLSTWLKERINSEILRLASNGYYLAKKILIENEDLLWALAKRLIQEDQVSQEVGNIICIRVSI